MNGGPNQNKPIFTRRYFNTKNQATSSNIDNSGALNIAMNPITTTTINPSIMTNNNHGTVQNNAQMVRQVNSSPLIPNQYNISFGVEPNNNTVHQQSGQSLQSVDQPLQLFQSPVNYIHQVRASNSHTMISPIIITTPEAVERRRPIIIDGLNIGYSHGQHKRFSAIGMLLGVQYFLLQGFNSVKVLIPQHHRGTPGTITHSVISLLMDMGHIYFTPSRAIQNVRLTCYSDRIILDHAITCNGVVVSNDNFRDLYHEKEEYKEIIEKRHLMFMFIDDIIIFPIDQYGHRHPNLKIFNILHFPA